MIRPKRTLAVLVALSMTLSAFMQPAQATLQATLISTEQVVQTTASVDAASNREKVTATLARPDVQAQLEKFGVDPVQARERVAALSDVEVARLAEQIDSAPAAGADVLGVIVFVFIVLLITDILGVTKVFPFTRTMR